MECSDSSITSTVGFDVVQDSSELPMTSAEILRQLEGLDQQLRVIESQGHELEDNIRKCNYYHILFQ